jgi:hypothetical protein
MEKPGDGRTRRHPLLLGIGGVATGPTAVGVGVGIERTAPDVVGNAISGSEHAAARFFVTEAVSRKDAIETDDGAFLAGIDGGWSELERR